MKFVNITVLFIILTFLSGCSERNSADGNSATDQVKTAGGITVSDVKSASQIPAVKKYPLKSGIISFEKNGIVGKRKTMVYFDDYGVKERNEIYNNEGNLEEIRFADGDKMYVINFKYSKDKIAYIMGAGHSGTEMKFIAEPFNNEKDKAKYDYKKLPNITVAGKDCEAYSMKSPAGLVVFAGWNNILLYSNTKISFGEVVTKAVEIKENVKVDPAMFKVPDDFQVKNM